MNYENAWKYFKKLNWDNNKLNSFATMCQIEDGTIIIECPECGSEVENEHGTLYCTKCDWYKE